MGLEGGVAKMRNSGRKHLEPDDKIRLNIPTTKANTILKDSEFLDDAYEQDSCETPIDKDLTDDHSLR